MSMDLPLVGTIVYVTIRMLVATQPAPAQGKPPVLKS